MEVKIPGRNDTSTGQSYRYLGVFISRSSRICCSGLGTCAAHSHNTTHRTFARYESCDVSLATWPLWRRCLRPKPSDPSGSNALTTLENADLFDIHAHQAWAARRTRLHETEWKQFWAPDVEIPDKLRSPGRVGGGSKRSKYRGGFPTMEARRLKPRVQSAAKG